MSGKHLTVEPSILFVYEFAGAKVLLFLDIHKEFIKKHVK